MKPRESTRAGGTDWAEVRARLDRAGAATAEALRLSPERARAVLEERARALARVPPAEYAGAVLEVVTFDLAGERYALETRHVRAVVRLGEHTPVPGAPDFLVGVLNLRGEVLAVMDLGKVLGLARRSWPSCTGWRARRTARSRGDWRRWNRCWRPSAPSWPKPLTCAARRGWMQR
jgi:hypothetical protein